MKKIIFILAITALVFSACGNKKKQEKAATHTHSDGTVHAGDTHSESETAPAQETFEVKPEEGTDHQHEAEGHEHEHEHEHEDHN